MKSARNHDKSKRHEEQSKVSKANDYGVQEKKMVNRECGQPLVVFISLVAGQLRVLLMRKKMAEHVLRGFSRPSGTTVSLDRGLCKK